MPSNVTGTLVDAATNLVSAGTFVRFQLRGTLNIQPVVTGVGALCAGSGTGQGYFVDFTPNASGVISGSVYSTRDSTGLLAGEITVNGNGTACWWEVSIWRGNKKISSVHTHAKTGATLDIGNLTAISTTPVATAPTGDTTYARLDGSNTPFTGIVQFLQGILLALGKSVAWSTDLFLGRGAAGKLTVGTTAGASDGTVSAASYQVGGVSQSGTGPLVAQTNAALTTPTLNSPSLVTPALGVATATSVNKVTITQPATGATLTILDGKTAKVDNTLELAGADGVKHTFPATAPTGGVLAYGVPKLQQFTANGTFTIPTGVTGVKVTVVGAGGGGGGAAATPKNGGGGGSGGLGIKWLTGLTPGNTLAVAIGTAGSAGATGAAGGNGTASSVASGTQTITSVIANGGQGGGGTLAASPGGGGGAAGTGGDLNLSGASGGFGNSANNIGGNGAPSFFSGGGAQSGGAGVTGTSFGDGGGGAGGAGANSGGAGSAGVVVFEWTA